MPQLRPSLNFLLPSALLSLLLVESSCAVHSPQPVHRPAFEAAPLPAEAIQRFAAYGDTRTHDDIHREIVALVMSFHPGWALQTGDLVAWGNQAGQWKTFDEITGAMRREIPFYPARGNHDGSPPTYYEQRVEQQVLSGSKLYYSFEKGDLHFVSIDTEQEVGPQTAQGLWLADDLAKAQAAGLYIIPFFHKAIFSVGRHAIQNDVLDLRKILHPLFLHYGVRFAIEGHDHIYYRTVRDGITYVVTGGGGAPLYGKEHPDIWQDGDVFESVNHICIVDEYADRLAVTAYRRDGTKVDEFDVRK
jgi:hypothetical protein